MIICGGNDATRYATNLTGLPAKPWPISKPDECQASLHEPLGVRVLRVDFQACEPWWRRNGQRTFRRHSGGVSLESLVPYRPAGNADGVHAIGIGELELVVLALRQQFEPDFAFGAAEFWGLLCRPDLFEFRELDEYPQGQPENRAPLVLFPIT
jgi:hypothetical protein